MADSCRPTTQRKVFGADFRLLENNCGFSLRKTAGNKRVHLSLPSRGESHLGTVSLPDESYGSHSTGTFTYATCTAKPFPTRVSSIDASVKEADGYVEALCSSLLVEVWDKHGKRPHAGSSMPSTTGVNRHILARLGDSPCRLGHQGNFQSEGIYYPRHRAGCFTSSLRASSSGPGP